MNPFSSTIGHTTAIEVLSRMISGNRLPHALMFVGPKSVGKTHIASNLIQQLFGTSQSMISLPDVILLKRDIDPKTSKRKSLISVKQVRAVIDRLSLSSFDGGWKVAFITEADRLSAGAANALLKTLEEPKGKTLIILRASSVESVLPTIASRCQTIRLSPVSKQEITLALQKRGLSKEEASLIAARSLGKPGLALRYVSDSELRARKETMMNQAKSLLRVSLPEQFRAVTELIPKTDVDKAQTLTKLLEDWSEVVRMEMIREIAASSEDPTPRNDNASRTLRAIQEVQQGLHHNINPHLALEHIFLATH